MNRSRVAPPTSRKWYGVMPKTIIHHCSLRMCCMCNGIVFVHCYHRETVSSRVIMNHARGRKILFSLGVNTGVVGTRRKATRSWCAVGGLSSAPATLLNIRQLKLTNVVTRAAIATSCLKCLCKVQGSALWLLFNFFLLAKLSVCVFFFLFGACSISEIIFP